MTGIDGNAATIDVRESRLRVIAGCAATTVAGWAVFAAGQVPGRGWGGIAWAGGSFWSFVLSALLLGRAFGRARRRIVWMLGAGYLLHLPSLVMLSRSFRHPETGARGVLDPTGGYLPLGIVSACLLGALAAVGYFLESPSVSSARQRSTD